MVRQEADKEKEYMNQLRKKKEYTQLIENNKVLAEYIRTHKPTVEEIKEFYKDSQDFCLRILTDIEFRDKFMEEIYHYLRSL